MGELASLITAIAALVTSIGGAGAAIIVASRSGRKTRREIDSGEEEEDGLSPEDQAALMELINKMQNPGGK